MRASGDGGWRVRLAQEDDGSGIFERPLERTEWREPPTCEDVVRCFYDPDGCPLDEEQDYGVSSLLLPEVGLVAQELERSSSSSFPDTSDPESPLDR